MLRQAQHERHLSFKLHKLFHAHSLVFEMGDWGAVKESRLECNGFSRCRVGDETENATSKAVALLLNLMAVGFLGGGGGRRPLRLLKNIREVCLELPDRTSS